MPILSKIYKIQNIPKEVLQRKLKKKLFRESPASFDSSYILAGDVHLKNGLFPIDVNFFKRYSIQFEDLIDNTLENKVKIFSNNYVKISDEIKKDYCKINWQKDYLSEFEWDVNTPSKDIKFGYGENEKDVNLRKYIGAEIKFPWEVGRQQDLVPLAIYYSISDNEKKQEIIDFYENRINDFSTNNPIGFGVQWQTSMDIALRAVNYLISYDILKSNGASFTVGFEEHLAQVIQDHYFYIYKHLEFNDGLRGNHYFANLMGLIIIYIYMDYSPNPDYDDFEEIFSFAVQSYSEEVLYQFNSDGGNFEASIPYHYFASEMLFLTLFFLEKCEPGEFVRLYQDGIEIKFEGELKNRILNILEFSRNFLIEENIPNIGDNDSGFVLNLLPFENIRYSFYLLLYKYEIGIKDLKFAVIKQILSELLFKNNSYYFAEKFGIARTSNKNFDLVVFAGNKGQKGKGGHSHNDKCSFELYFNGQPLIVDLGSAFYTSNWGKRNYYRSVRQHNTLHNGYEQDVYLADERDDLFWLYGNKTKSEIVYANDEHITCSHFGFGKQYTREIFVKENSIEGIENLQNNKQKFLNFHFHPECQVEIENSFVKISCNGSRFLLMCENVELKLEDAVYSSGYGIENKCLRLVLLSKEFEIKWKLELIES